MLICSPLYSLKCNMNSGPVTCLTCAYIELVDVLNVRARIPFSFHMGLPSPSKWVVVVDQIAAHDLTVSPTTIECRL